jgi:hypothetical protein
MLLFKKISWQKGIKGTKDKIKGNMIAIRIYQDDLVVVGKAVVKVLLRNFQYLGLNFGPFIPLSIPFILVAVQLVVRYSFAPIPVVGDEALARMLPGEGTLIEVEFKAADRGKIADLTLDYPSGLKPVSQLVRSISEGKAYQEVVATSAGVGEIEILVGGTRVGTKEVVTGSEPTRLMQPERVASPWVAWMWPAEDTFGSDSPVARVVLPYPDRDLPWLPDGPLAVFMTFVVVAFAFGLILIKPLKIQI